MKRDMESRDYFIAVIDIGKTNKKVLVFSSDLKLQHQDSIQIGEVTKENLLCDDIETTEHWILNSLKKIGCRYSIEVISTTTHGATVVHLGKNGEMAFPVISYQHHPGEDVLDGFYAVCGRAEDLYLTTATPPLGQFLNVGLQLFWLKESYPQRFAKVKKILFLPQYIGFLLTGNAKSEPTSIGCHTCLYDFLRKDWSDVVTKLDIKDKFPAKFSNPWDRLGTVKEEIHKVTGLDKKCLVSVGIHDSNASLLPYLISKKKSFVLASTGTWCAFFYPGSNFHLEASDMNKDTLYYLDPFGRPVRASRFKGGEEHEHYCSLIEERFGCDVKKTQPDVKRLEEILRDCDCFVIPGLTPGAGQFPNSKPGIISEKKFYRDAGGAYHLLNLFLAIQSYVAIDRILGKEAKSPIFVEGGFTQNAIYLSLLSTLFPQQEVSSTDIKQATSLGAAICGKCAYEKINPFQIDRTLVDINEKPIRKLDIDRKLFNRYMDKFLRHCAD